VDEVSDLRKSQDNRIVIKDPMDTLKSVVISPSDICNRKCSFCPHGNGYDGCGRVMDVGVAKRIGDELRRVNFRGRVGLSGNGEPLINQNIVCIAEAFSGLDVELMTNGDYLDEYDIRWLSRAGIKRYIISLHDGEQQVEFFNHIFRSAGEKNYILRRQWNAEQVHITNRCGAVYTSEELKRPCFLPFYKMEIRVDGSLGLCSQDWNCEFRTWLNILTSRIEDLWLSDEINEYRKKLLYGERSNTPCNKCDVDGMVNGEASFGFFRRFLNEHN